MKNTTSYSRRHFLKSAGCLTISFPLLGGCWPASGETTLAEELPGSLSRYPRINAWLEVLEDGRVRILTGKIELGQGIRTAITQVAAEELNMDLELVEVVLAETGRTPNEGYTAGSGSIKNSAMAVRYAAASARQKLLELAATKLNTKAAQLHLANGAVNTQDGAKSLTFSEILEGTQIEDEVKLPVTLKPKSDYKYVGKAILRDDIEKMVRGEPVYVHDLRFPGMVHARVVRPKGYQSTLTKFDEAALKAAVPGVLKTVVNGSFLGVIAEEEYQAVKAHEFLQKNTEWLSAASLPAGQPLPEYLKTIADADENVKNMGDVNAASADNSSHKAAYFKPYIMHGAIGPACAVALYENDKLHIWSHSQGVYPLREGLQTMLGMEADKIHIKGVPGAGCFGHNPADDAAADAALLAMEYPGKHVRVQWMRQDEHGWEPYGSAMLMELEAALDSQGKINAWKADLWSDSHSTRPNENAGTLVTARYLEKPFQMQSPGYRGGGYRNAEPYYTIPNQQIDAHFFTGPLRVSSLRSLGAYANIFAIESFMDELAEKAGKDPLTFRLEHSEDERAIAILRKIKEMTQSQSAAENEGVGYAFSRYKNSDAYCAVAAKVGVNPDTGAVQLKNMWAAIDAGEAINLDGLANQTEGGMLQAASWTLMEEVKFDEQHVSSLDWGTYPIFRFSDIPQVEVAVINRPDMPCLGGGEASQAPASAAIANAVYQACGKRVRDLPIRAEKIVG